MSDGDLSKIATFDLERELTRLERELTRRKANERDLRQFEELAEAVDNLGVPPRDLMFNGRLRLDGGTLRALIDAIRSMTVNDVTFDAALASAKTRRERHWGKE